MSEKRNAQFVCVDSIVADNLPPGAAKFTETDGKIAGLNFICPCGCRKMLGVSFEPGRWTWNGDREKPTVRPSILHMDGCRWHGFLTDGEFREC